MSTPYTCTCTCILCMQIAMIVLIPVKRLCNSRLHTTPATVYTKTKPTGDTAQHIDTKKNEVYGMSLQLTDSSIIKSIARYDHR